MGKTPLSWLAADEDERLDEGIDEAMLVLLDELTDWAEDEGVEETFLLLPQADRQSSSDTTPNVRQSDKLIIIVFPEVC